MTEFEVGFERIKDAVAKAAGKPIIFIEHLRNFGDCCHSTIIIRHYRRTYPRHYVIWGISEKYTEEFKTLFSLVDGPHAIVSLPHGPPFPDDGPLRVQWARAAEKLPGVTMVIKPGVHPWGWQSGSLTDAIFHNAGITKLAVERQPVMPLDITDYQWSDKFLTDNKLEKYITLEYRSHSLQTHPVEWYNEFVALSRLPVVYFGGLTDPVLPRGVNCLGCTYRQAKVMIMRSRCFVGCASGNGLMAASDGVTTPFVEVVDAHIGLQNLGYIHKHRVYHCTGFAVTPTALANLVNGI